MSAGSFAYHSGSAPLVGKTPSGPVGIAVLSTESTESRVGSIVFRSIARPSNPSWGWMLRCTSEANATMARAGRIEIALILPMGW